MTDDLAELLRQAAGPQAPLAPAAIRDRVARRRRRRSRRVAVSGAAAAVVIVAAALSVLSRPAEDGDSLEAVGAPTPGTVLPPPGADPQIACDVAGPFFPASALDGPSDAAEVPGAANDVLRQMLDDAAGEPSSYWPRTGWREVVRTDDLVAFLAPAPPDDGRVGGVGTPYVVTYVGSSSGVWSLRSGGGSCHPWIAPPEGTSLVAWTIDPDRPPTPGDTEIHLEVTPPTWCGTLTEDQLVGPDVVEAADTITVRLALEGPPPTVEETGSCERGDPAGAPLEVTVPLREPFGTREVVDLGRYPAIPLVLPDPPPSPDPRGPLVEFEGGTVTLPVQVVTDLPGTGPCDRATPSCPSGTRATLAFTVGDTTLRVDTDDDGWATARVPDHDQLTITATAPGQWCSTIRMPTQFVEPDPAQRLGCTPEGGSEATLRGSASAIDDPVPVLIFQNDDRFVAGTVAGADGAYEVVLGPGRWVVRVLATAGGTYGCTPGEVTIEPGQDQRLDVVCPYTQDAAAEILQRLIESQGD